MLILNILFRNLIVDFGGAGTKLILWKIEVVAQQYICLLMNMFFNFYFLWKADCLE